MAEKLVFLRWCGLLAHAMLSHRNKMLHAKMSHAIMANIVPLLHVQNVSFL
jgi:hypothetical protein